MTDDQLTRRARRESLASATSADDAPDAPGTPDDLIAYAREWAADDPDVATRRELEEVLAAAEGGDEAALAELRDRCAGLLEFGTAGLRGALGAGPNRMNRAVVIRAAAGLMAYLRAHLPAGREPSADDLRVVIGFDARLGSAEFARDTAAVVMGAGGTALVLPRPLPTPVLAFAIRHLRCAAGVMVTASHNPAQDNGYKVYVGDGSQIVPPADVEIRREIEGVRTVADVPRPDDGWQVLGEEVVTAYVEAVAALVPPDAPRAVSVVQTSMHGVGGEIVRRVFEAAGFDAPTVVPEQHDPDPAFPTVPFPNPEESGAIDLALALARANGPDVVLANDPDADRCAAAIPDPLTATPTDPAGWRMLHGDELGALLAWDVVQGGVREQDVLARSIVSSRLIDAVARAAGCRATQTLTGFKWIARAPGLRYGYEEAIGYCVAPQVVRDKDGISAALQIAAVVARLKSQGRTVRDVLDELALAHGVYASDAFSVRVADLALIGAVMTRLRSSAAETTQIAGVAMSALDDLDRPTDGLPPTDGLRYLLADDSRVIVRPSGTEPKLKVYLEAIVPVEGGADGLTAARGDAARRLGALREAFEAMTRI
ncbi:MAG: phospho-sugar mutase [Austwickia sp.]|nr:phospho-sugar mutase [Austwickia sp.]